MKTRSLISKDIQAELESAQGEERTLLQEAIDQAENTADRMFAEEIEKFVLLPKDFENILGPEKVADGRTMSIYCCGTCSNQNDWNNERYFNGENVSHTYTIDKGEPFVDKIIVDGPGSGEQDAASLWLPYTPYSPVRGVLLGAGIDERLKHILGVLKNQPQRELTPEEKIIQEKIATANETKPVTRINMVGWSRGAAACIELCNRIARDPTLKHIEINLVLLDPVPGGGLSHADNRTLPDNVKNCYIIFSEDERSMFFNPVLPDHPPTCNFYTIILPGGHAQVAGDETDHAGKPVEDADLRGVGKISRYYIEHLLKHFGSNLDPEKMSTLTLRDVCAEYNVIMENRDAYREVAQRVPYTLSQILGTNRKVIAGNANLTNQDFEVIHRQTGKSRHKAFIDATHQELNDLIEGAEKWSASFISALQAELKSNDLLNVEPLFEKLMTMVSVDDLKDYRLLTRAIGEAMQEKLSYQDLDDVNKRIHTSEELKVYLHQKTIEMVNIHNQLIQNEMRISQLNTQYAGYKKTILSDKRNDLIQTNIKALDTLFNQLTKEKMLSAKLLSEGFILRYKEMQSDSKKLTKKYNEIVNVQAQLNELAKQTRKYIRDKSDTTDTIMNTLLHSDADAQDRYTTLHLSETVLTQLIAREKKLRHKIDQFQEKMEIARLQSENLAKAGIILVDDLKETLTYWQGQPTVLTSMHGIFSSLGKGMLDFAKRMTDRKSELEKMKQDALIARESINHLLSQPDTWLAIGGLDRKKLKKQLKDNMVMLNDLNDEMIAIDEIMLNVNKHYNETNTKLLKVESKTTTERDAMAAAFLAYIDDLIAIEDLAHQHQKGFTAVLNQIADFMPIDPTLIERVREELQILASYIQAEDKLRLILRKNEKSSELIDYVKQHPSWQTYAEERLQNVISEGVTFLKLREELLKIFPTSDSSLKQAASLFAGKKTQASNELTKQRKKILAAHTLADLEEVARSVATEPQSSKRFGLFAEGPTIKEQVESALNDVSQRKGSR